MEEETTQTQPESSAGETQPEAGEHGAEQTSAGTENTDASTREHMIPKSRLDQEIRKRKEELAKREELQAKLAEYERKASEATSNGETEQQDVPPAHLSEREKVRWYIERDSRRLIENELGMSLKDAKTLLAALPSQQKDYATRRWNELCGQHGLDPKDSEVQELVAGLVKVGKSAEDSVERVAKLLGKSQQQKESRPEVEMVEDGVTLAMAGERMVPRDRKQAMEMARKGQRAPVISSVDIIRQSMERAANNRK